MELLTRYLKAYWKLAVLALVLAAIAALIVGNWKIVPTFAACLIFGFARSGAYALVLRLNADASVVDLAMIAPYVITLLLLIFFGKSNRAPRALGELYDRSKR